MVPFSAEAKLSLIKRAIVGEKVARLCREAGVSRKTFYSWLKIYKKSRPNVVKIHLSDKRFKQKATILALHPKERLLLVNKALIKEASCAKLCRDFGVSRKTLYKWLKRYDQLGELGLGDIRVRGEEHPRTIPQEKKQKLLELISQNPEHSVHKLYQELRGEIGHHGIQNILLRENLNTISKRKLWAEGFIYKPKAAVAPLYEPTIPLYKWRLLFAPFKTVPKLLVTSPSSGLLRLGFISLPLLAIFLFLRMLVGAAPGSSTAGLFFASVALTFGFFFFIYSMKYYITILMVLKLASSGTKAMEDKQSRGSQRENVILSIAKNLLRPFGFRPQGDRMPSVNPLLINLEKIGLAEYPFVSVHVALYNEKRVVERLIRATTNQEYGNPSTSLRQNSGQALRTCGPSMGSGPAGYEVVLVDDSTDETTEITKQLLSANGRQLRTVSGQQEVEMYISTPPHGSGQPVVKLIHRLSRAGFKGGALQAALENTDPRADYITIFDADFVPYPDTITQFVKTFQVLTTNDERKTTNAENEALSIEPSALSVSNIAAVQGYQWHVLNKSQTWVTRGVRTEYAGSYVIERAGEEIYGGLKQISGSVYCIRANVLRQFGWGTSITEDFELTLRLYEAGYKVAFTPYIQAPAEAVSTIRRLIRQRMRWAEGASFNVKCMLPRMLGSRNMTRAEKFEFFYLAPYYLQAAFFVIGTISWFISEAIFNSRLPFWTAAFGWSLVFTNLLALPLMNIVGLFLEESEERDYIGILSFVALSYIVVPFQAYAAIKGFLESAEGPWFRTPKTGIVTDTFGRSHFAKFFGNILGGQKATAAVSFQLPANRPVFLGAFNPLNAEHFAIRPRHFRHIGNLALVFVIAITTLMSIAAPFMPIATSYAQGGPKIKTVDQVANAGRLLSTTGQESNEITTPRAFQKMTKDGKPVKFIFNKEPKVRIKLESQEIELETKTIGERSVGPTKSEMSGAQEVNYTDIVEGVDLKYKVTGDLLAEEFILKTPQALEKFGEGVEQTVNTFDVKVVSPRPSAFGFYGHGDKEIFKLSDPFIKDAAGKVIYDINMNLEKSVIGYKLTKKIGEGGKRWLSNPIRQFPIVVDPSVIVSTGIADANTQYGSLQRKVVYVSSNWYAFYSSSGILYKKSSDGVTWGSPVTVDATTSSVNPSVYLSGTTIYAAWIDTTNKTLKVNTINTASADGQGTQCTSASQGTINSTFTISIAVDSGGVVYLAFSDTSTDNSSEVYKLTFSGCTFTAIAPTTISWVKTIGTNSTRATCSTPPCTLAITVPAAGVALGNTIVVSAVNSTASSVASASDTRGNTYTNDASIINGTTVESTILSAPVTAALVQNNTITVSWATAVNIRVVAAEEYSGIAQSSYVDKTKTGTGADANPTTGASAATTQPDELVFGSFGNSNGTTAATFTAGTSPNFTARSHVSTGTTGANRTLDNEELIVNSVAAYTAKGTYNASFTWAAAAATYKGKVINSRPVLVTMGTNLHMIFQDGNLSHSVYNGTSWTTTNATIASVTDNVYDVTTDGTNIWALTVSGTTATNLYKFNGTTWSSLTAPYTSATNLTAVSITYDSTNSKLYAHVLKDASNQAYFESSDATTISWSAATSYGFTAGSLAQLSSPMTAAGSGQIGVVVRQNANFEFAAVPEQLWMLLTVLPFMPKMLEKVRKRRKYRLQI